MNEIRTKMMDVRTFRILLVINCKGPAEKFFG
jgi:hypothetical protein